MGFTVPAAGSIPVEVVVSLPIRRAGGAKSHPFVETIQLLIAGDSRRERPTWRIRGNAVRALTLDREQLSLGTALVYGVEHESRAVGIVVAQNVSRVVATATSDDLIPKLYPLPGAGSTHWTLEVQSLPTVTPGPLVGEVVLKAYDEQGELIGGAEALSVIGSVICDVSVDLEAVVLGAVPVSGSAFAHVELSSRTDSPFRVLSIEASSPEISWTLASEEDPFGRPVRVATLESSDVSPVRAIEYQDWNESIARLRNLGKADASTTECREGKHVARIRIEHSPSRVGQFRGELRISIKSEQHDAPFPIRIPIVSFGQMEVKR